MLAHSYKQLRPFAVVGFLVLVWLAGINVILSMLATTQALQWLPDRNAGIGYVLESRQRVEAATRAFETQATPRTKPVVAVIGISDVREGVRLVELTAAGRNEAMFIGVAGAGAGIGSIEEQALIALDSRLRPDVYLIGISPLAFIDNNDLRRGAQSAAASPSRLASIRSRVRDMAWIVTRRADFSGWFQSSLGDVRASILRSLRLEVRDDGRSPWRPMLRTLGVEHYPPALLEQSLKTLRASGVSERQTFERNPALYVRAGSLIRRIREQGSRVVVLQMPRHPKLNALLPSGIDALAAERLRAESGDEDLPVLNYSTLISAEGFIDLVHLNTKGGQLFSKRLGADFSKLGASKDFAGSRFGG